MSSPTLSQPASSGGQPHQWQQYSQDRSNSTVNDHGQLVTLDTTASRITPKVDFQIDFVERSKDFQVGLEATFKLAAEIALSIYSEFADRASNFYALMRPHPFENFYEVAFLVDDDALYSAAIKPILRKSRDMHQSLKCNQDITVDLQFIPDHSMDIRIQMSSEGFIFNLPFTVIEELI